MLWPGGREGFRVGPGFQVGPVPFFAGGGERAFSKGRRAPGACPDCPLGVKPCGPYSLR